MISLGEPRLRVVRPNRRDIIEKQSQEEWIIIGKITLKTIILDGGES